MDARSSQEETNALFRRVFERSPIATAILDRDAQYTHVNLAWTRLVGFELSDLEGMTPASLTHPDDRATDAPLLRSLLAGEIRTYSRVNRYVRRDGIIVHVRLNQSVISGPDDQPLGYVGQLEDITAQVEAQKAIENLQAEVSRQAAINETVLKHLPLAATFLIDRDLRYLAAHGPSVPVLLGMTPEELLGRSIEDVVPEPRFSQGIGHVRATLEGASEQFEVVRKARTFGVRTAPIYGDGTFPVAALIHMFDVTERKIQEAALKAERERFRALVTHAPVGIFEMDSSGNMVFTNECWQQITGLSPELARAPETRTAPVHAEDRPRLRLAWDEAQRAGRPFNVDFRLRQGDGTEKRLSSTAAPLRDGDGQTVGYIGVTLDVTAQRNAADATERSLREKETLLKEIHHRVKNNLQVIGSIIGLQASRANDEKVHLTFADLRNRIHTIALLHERLYGSPELGALDLGEYLDGLVADTARAAGATPHQVTLQRVGPPIIVGLDDAMPVGLIANELVTNAIKHGCGRGRGSAVAVQLAFDGQMVRLIVGDDGPGFPTTLDPEASKSLGMLLLTSLARQLRGEIDFQNDPTRSTLCFPWRSQAR